MNVIPTVLYTRASPSGLQKTTAELNKKDPDPKEAERILAENVVEDEDEVANPPL